MALPSIILELKSDLSLDDSVSFINELTSNGEKSFEELLIALPYLRLKEMTSQFPESGITFGVSEMFSAMPNRFSAPVAAILVKEAKGSFALIGTKEERLTLKNPEEEILAKILACKKEGIKPIYVFGEEKALSDDEIRNELETFTKSEIFSFDPHPVIVIEPPFKTFEHYFPTTQELKAEKKRYDAIFESVFEQERKKLRLFLSLPADLQGFTEGIKSNPFDGTFLKKSGIYPHTVHQETLELFHVDAKS